MKKILFLIHDLGPGGAEKVLVNLVNNLDRTLFDITVISLFGGGVNEQFLKSDVRYHVVWKKAVRGNIHLMKLLTPKQLHRMIIKEHYDIEVSYLEGPSARIISGCEDSDTKLFSWIHVEQHTKEIAARAFRSYKESVNCYKKFDKLVCVSQDVKKDFMGLYPDVQEPVVVHNVLETDKIIEQNKEPVEPDIFKDGEIRLVGVGKLMPIKGFDKLLRIHKSLKEEGYPVHTYILGDGPDKGKLEAYINENQLQDSCTLLGYQTNPYKYVARCDVFVCCSTAEGFSTAATEALILGIPIVTTPVAGMNELISNSFCGLITDFEEYAVQEGIKTIINSTDCIHLYKENAKKQGELFSQSKSISDNILTLLGQ